MEKYPIYFVNQNRELIRDDGTIIDLLMVRRDGTFISPRTTQHTSSVIQHDMNFPEFDFHSLRHTHATVLAELGADIKYAQMRLGHKTVAVTLNIYQHVSDELKDKNNKNVYNDN